MNEENRFYFTPIGFINSPFEQSAPRQPQPDAEGEFKITIDEQFTKGLSGLKENQYIYVLFWLNRIGPDISMIVTPHRDRKPRGLFASRSPHRPNPIGLSVVQIRYIQNNMIYISGIDALNNTPVLDIKPYSNELLPKQR